MNIQVETMLINGGAIYYNCQAKCPLVIKNTKFAKNEADFIGGAIYSEKFIVDTNKQNVEFEDNYAGYYGKDLASQCILLLFYEDVNDFKFGYDVRENFRKLGRYLYYIYIYLLCLYIYILQAIQ